MCVAAHCNFCCLTFGYWIRKRKEKSHQYIFHAFLQNCIKDQFSNSELSSKSRKLPTSLSTKDVIIPSDFAKSCSFIQKSGFHGQHWYHCKYIILKGDKLHFSQEIAFHENHFSESVFFQMIRLHLQPCCWQRVLHYMCSCMPPRSRRCILSALIFFLRLRRRRCKLSRTKSCIL